MLNGCRTVLHSFENRVTRNLTAQRRKDRLAMMREKNREPCVQGDWHKLPYPKRQYHEINAYQAADGLDSSEATRVMTKLKTTMTRKAFVDAMDREDYELQSACDRAIVAAAAKLTTKNIQKKNKNNRKTKDMNERSKNLKENAAKVAAPVNSNEKSEPVNSDTPKNPSQQALEKVSIDRKSVSWHVLRLDKGDIVERDTWGIDCYTRKSIELALSLVPLPLRMTRGMNSGISCSHDFYFFFVNYPKLKITSVSPSL